MLLAQIGSIKIASQIPNTTLGHTTAKILSFRVGTVQCPRLAFSIPRGKRGSILMPPNMTRGISRTGISGHSMLEAGDIAYSIDAMKTSTKRKENIKE